QSAARGPSIVILREHCRLLCPLIIGVVQSNHSHRKTPTEVCGSPRRSLGEKVIAYNPCHDGYDFLRSVNRFPRRHAAEPVVNSIPHEFRSISFRRQTRCLPGVSLCTMAMCALLLPNCLPPCNHFAVAERFFWQRWR